MRCCRRKFSQNKNKKKKVICLFKFKKVTRAASGPQLMEVITFRLRDSIRLIEMVVVAKSDVLWQTSRMSRVTEFRNVLKSNIARALWYVYTIYFDRHLFHPSIPWSCTVLWWLSTRRAGSSTYVGNKLRVKRREKYTTSTSKRR